MDKLEQIIKSVNIVPKRNLELENRWLYEDNRDEVDKLLSHYCEEATFSKMFKIQLSQLLFQRYIVIENQLISVSIFSLLDTLKQISVKEKRQKTLRNISKKVGFDVQHAHFGESLFITENWRNYARNTGLDKRPLNLENMYESLIDSRANHQHTGEWVVFSNQGAVVRFWCLWLHEAGDETLIRLIKEHT